MAPPEDGMDRALSMARDLYTAADNAVRQGWSTPEEEKEAEALADIRDHIQNLEMKVRQARTTKEEATKAALINEVDPLRRRVIAKCHEHQAYVRRNNTLVQRILDWCELKEAPARQYNGRSSAEDVPRSTDMVTTWTNPLSISDVSSGWVQSQARSSSHSKAFDATSLSLMDWETNTKQPGSLLAAKAVGGRGTAAAAASSSLTVSPAGTGSGSGSSRGPRSPSRRSPTRRAASAAQLQQQQLLGAAAGARGSVPDQYSKLAEQVLGAAAQKQQQQPIVAVAAMAASNESQQAIIEAVRAKLGLARSSYGLGPAGPAAAAAGVGVGGACSSFDLEQQQGWKVTTEVMQQQAARQIRPPRAFLHLDGAGDASVTSSGGLGRLSAHSSAASLAEQGDSVLIGGLGRYRADEDAFEPVLGASSGWEAVQHLRQQHPGMRASLRTSSDVTRALLRSDITEAAYLRSMASQVHILHDAVPQKPQGADGVAPVPVVPPSLAVRKRQRWWGGLLKLLAGAAGTAAVVAAVALGAGGVLSDSSCGSDSVQPSKQQQQLGKAQLQEQQQQQQTGMPRLRYVPVGPAPDASAGCG